MEGNNDIFTAIASSRSLLDFVDAKCNAAGSLQVLSRDYMPLLHPVVQCDPGQASSWACMQSMTTHLTAPYPSVLLLLLHQCQSAYTDHAHARIIWYAATVQALCVALSIVFRRIVRGHISDHAKAVPASPFQVLSCPNALPSHVHVFDSCI